MKRRAPMTTFTVESGRSTPANSRCARLRKDDPNLSLRAYVLSVTPAARIDDGLRSASEWKRDGVYFLDEPDWLRQVIEHALGPEARAA